MIENIGNGIGYIYKADASGNFVSSHPNFPGPLSLNGVRNTALIAWPLAGEQYSYTILQITGVPGSGSLTALSVNSVSIITSPVAVTVSNPAQTATDIAAEINATNSSPQYTAVASGSNVFIYSFIPGAAPNGRPVAVTMTGAAFVAPQNLRFGNDASASEYRYFLDATTSAQQLVLSGDEITDYIVRKGLESGRKITSMSVVSGGGTVDRESAFMIIDVSMTGTIISNLVVNGALDGDQLTLRPATASDLFTLDGTGNIVLGRGNFTAVTENDIITLRRVGTSWVEVMRSTLTAEEIRVVANIPVEKGVEQVTVPAGGGTLNVSPGITGTPPVGTTYKNEVELNGNPTLTSNYTVAFVSTNAADGEKVTVKGSGLITLGSNTLTVFGITIPSQLALSGRWEVTGVYDGTALNATLKASVEEAGWIDPAVMIPAGSIAPDRLDDDSNERPVIMQVTFETGELGNYQFRFPPGEVTNMYYFVNKTLDSTDAGTISVVCGGISATDFNQTFAAGDPFGTSYNNPRTTPTQGIITSGSPLIEITTAKTTAGGKVQVVVWFKRTA